MKIFTKPYYCYTIDDDDDEYQTTVWVQDIQWKSRNRIVKHATSIIYDSLEDAIAWGEHQVRALQKG